jgi:hypothetical protein
LESIARSGHVHLLLGGLRTVPPHAPDPRDGAVRFRVAATLRVGHRLLMSLALICGAKGRRET